MALIKTPAEVEAMAEGGRLLSLVLQELIDMVKPGVLMKDLDAHAERRFAELGATPSFKGYKGGGKTPFPATVCISRNEEVVHGIGTRNIALAEGDIVGLDIGCWYKGLCTDMAVTVPVGKISAERLQLLRVTRDAMRAGVAEAKGGNTVMDIGIAVEGSLNIKKYGIVTALVGHGVGHAVHESPNVPNFVSDDFPKVSLKPGMCIAIEPMITRGTDDVEMAPDGWTIVTADGSDAGHFEVTVAITEGNAVLLTPEPRVPLLDL